MVVDLLVLNVVVNTVIVDVLVLNTVFVVYTVVVDLDSVVPLNVEN